MTDSEITPEPGPGLLDAPRPRVALALGSGGARGYAHIGVIDELHARGYEIVGVAGSSMGALVGGLQAAGRTGRIHRVGKVFDASAPSCDCWTRR